MEYHKINGLYKRYRKDLHTKEELPNNKKYGDFIINDFAKPEFSSLFHADWIWTEKLHGTNMRICIPSDKSRIKLRGKTNSSSIHTELYDWFLDYIEINEKIIRDIFPDGATLYGEGVGRAIQNGTLFGNQHIKIFDIKVGNLWLNRESVDEIAISLNLQSPDHFIGTIHDAIEKVKTKPKSLFGDFTIEGYVGQPVDGLLDRFGERICTKIKVCDFT